MKIDTATSGYDTINKILKNHYDIVFMDHMMPDMDRIETTKKIRMLNNREFKDKIIIALTANAIIGAKDMFLENGMNDFLSKPIEMKELNAILNKWTPENLKDKLDKEIFKKEEINKKIEIKIKDVDVEKSIENNGFTEQAYLEILKAFLIEGNNKIDLISQHANFDLQRYIIEIHGLKSALANIGAYNLSESARMLEEAGKIGDTKYIESNNEHFIDDYKKMLLNISQVINLYNNKEKNEDKNCKNNTLSLEKLNIMLSDTKRYLDDFDSENAISVIQKIFTYNIDESIYGKLNKILDEINVFQYEAALTKIDDIIYNSIK